jgi:hypothetical protein
MFALRQKKDLHFQIQLESEYMVVKDLGILSGMRQFYRGILANQGDSVGPFNWAIY